MKIMNYIDNNSSRKSKQDEINLINCMLIKYIEEFINSMIRSLTGKCLIFGIKVCFFIEKIIPHY